MKVSPKHLYIVDKVKKIYESIIKTPVHSGQGTCTESITMQFPRFKNKPRVILFFYNQSVTMLCCFYVLLPVKLLVDISNNAMETCKMPSFAALFPTQNKN